MKKKSQKSLEKEKVKDWGRKIFERDGGRCQVCVSLGIDKDLGTHYNPHHIITKRCKDLRLDVMNGILLCFTHHTFGVMSAHNNALFFADWLKKNKKEQYDYLIEKIREMEKK